MYTNLNPFPSELELDELAEVVEVDEEPEAVDVETELELELDDVELELEADELLELVDVVEASSVTFDEYFRVTLVTLTSRYLSVPL